MASETKVFFKLEKPEKEKVFVGSSKRVRVSGEEDEYRSYEESNIGMWANQDGAIGLTDWQGEGMVFLYPDQLEHLQKCSRSRAIATKPNKACSRRGAGGLNFKHSWSRPTQLTHNRWAHRRKHRTFVIVPMSY